MFKWILIIFLVYFWIWIYLSYTSANTEISKQMDVKTMSFSNPSYITETYKVCDTTAWRCQNRSSSSSSSWWGGSSSWK